MFLPGGQPFRRQNPAAKSGREKKKVQSQAEEASAGRDASARAQIAALVESALAITLRDLSLHGNAPGVVQRNALRDLLIGLSHQALSGGKPGWLIR